jgi:hypothetical protein
MQGLCKPTVSCGDTICNNNENCATCPGDCPTNGKKCCNGVIKDCCVAEDCYSDPSACVQGVCKVDGTCGTIHCVVPYLCCVDEVCDSCGGIGGIGNFGGQAAY